jgi:protein O-mannosyl-transferase
LSAAVQAVSLGPDLVDTDSLSWPPLQWLTRAWARNPRTWVCLGLVLGLAVVFWPVGGHEFADYDDDAYVTKNARVQAGLTWNGVAWAFNQVHGEQTYWHPLTWISHMLDCQIFGPKPAGHHLANLFLHIVNALLVFVVFERLTGALGRSAILAALFGLHALQVDTVAWVAERKNLLSALFWLLCMWAYVRYAQCRKQEADNTRRQPATSFYLFSLCFFALGLMCKPVLVTLPCVMLLLDYWPVERMQNEGSEDPRRAGFILHPSSFILLEKLPFFALAAASSLLTLLGHQGLGMLQAGSQLPLELRLENAVVSYVRYLGKTFWPVKLAVFYPYPLAWPMGQVVASGLLLLGMSALAVLAVRRRPWLFVGWFWFVGVLVPFIGVVQVGKQALADRFMYVPLIGVLMILVWGAAEFLGWLGLARKGIAFVCAAVLALCAARTVDQLRHWQSSEALFRHALAVTEDNCVAWDGLGVALFGRGRLDEAMECYRQALKINPTDAHALNNLGAALGAKGSSEDINWYRKALEADPGFPEALYNLGTAKAGQKHYAEALGLFEAVLRIQPDHFEARNNLGNTLANLGRPEEAIAQYRLALQLQVDAARIHRNLAALLVRQGKLDEAVWHYRQAVTQIPKDAEARYQLGIALALQEKWGEAIKEYGETLRLAPDNAEVRYNLGYALRSNGRLDEAIRELSQALRLKQDFPVAQYNLGCALAETGQREEALSHLREAVRLKPDYSEAKRELERLAAKPQTNNER